MRKYLAIVATLLLLPNSLRAELDWLYEARDCSALTAGVTQYFSQRDPRNLTNIERAELRLVLFEACASNRFPNCNLAVCSQAKALEKQEERPLFWLADVSTCEDFKTGFKINYARFSDYQALTAEQRIEVDYVLQKACSPALAHCGFKQCKNAIQAQAPQSEPSPEALASLKNRVESELHMEQENKSAEQLEFEAALSRYDALVASEHAQRAIRIEMRMDREAEGSLTWKTAVNPMEMQELAERREREAREPAPADQRNIRGTGRTPGLTPRAPRQGGSNTRKPRIPLDGGAGGSPLVY